jgi:hypothetical protein
MHAPRDMPSGEPRPGPGGGHPRTQPIPHESRGQVTGDERSYPKPVTQLEKVPLRLGHAVSAANLTLPQQSSSQPHYLARNNTCITNDDVGHDPKQNTPSQGPVLMPPRNDLAQGVATGTIGAVYGSYSVRLYRLQCILPSMMSLIVWLSSITLPQSQTIPIPL